MNQTQGYTIMEILITIVILGVLAGLAFPSFTSQMMRVRAQEAVPILRALYAAQIDFDREHPPVDNVYSTDFNSGELDVDISGSLDNFNNPNLTNAGNTINCAGGTSGVEVARMGANNISPDIRLTIFNNGTIVCRPTGNGAVCPGVCSQWGFTPCCPP